MTDNKIFTKAEIIKQLKDLKVPQDRPVIVHTSLKSVGLTENGGQGLLDALVEYVTAKGGLLVVPTHTFVNFYRYKKEIALDFNDFKPCIGAFPQIAVDDGRGVTALNPTHSVTVFGGKERVSEFVDCEKDVDTPTSPKGSYGKIFDLDGYSLLIGVGQDKNTILHCVEEMLSVPNRLSKEKASVGIKFRDGTIFKKDSYYMRSEGIYDPSEYFTKYEPAFRYYGAIEDGFIGNAKTQLCSAKIMKNVMELIRKNSGGIELLSDDKPLDIAWYKNK